MEHDVHFPEKNGQTQIITFPQNSQLQHWVWCVPEHIPLTLLVLHGAAKLHFHAYTPAKYLFFTQHTCNKDQLYSTMLWNMQHIRDFGHAVCVAVCCCYCGRMLSWWTSRRDNTQTDLLWKASLGGRSRLRWVRWVTLHLPREPPLQDGRHIKRAVWSRWQDLLWLFCPALSSFFLLL